MHGAKSFLSAFLTTWVAEYLCLVKNFFKAASVLRLNSLATWLKISASTHFPLLASFLCFRNILFAKGLLAPLPPTSELWPVNRRRPVRGGSGWITLWNCWDFLPHLPLLLYMLMSIYTFNSLFYSGN